VLYVREFVKKTMGLLFHMFTDDNKSDGFTKPLGKLKFHPMVKDLGMVMVQTTAEEEC
jgi:hypothetical protein